MCWFKENLNIGTMIPSNTLQTNNSIIEKYCFNDSLINCSKSGGLYSWDEMMQYTIDNGGQGICPTGWHVPTETEYCDMFHFLDPTVTCSSGVLVGTDAGEVTKEAGLTHWAAPNIATNTSGMSFRGVGNCGYNPDHTIYNWMNYEKYALLWTSTQINATNAHKWVLYNNQANALRYFDPKYMTQQVRCVKTIGITDSTLIHDTVKFGNIFRIKSLPPIRLDTIGSTILQISIDTSLLPHPAAQVNSDWNSVSGVSQILNKPTIPVAVRGDSLQYVVTDTNARNALSYKKVGMLVYVRKDSTLYELIPLGNVIADTETHIQRMFSYPTPHYDVLLLPHCDCSSYNDSHYPTTKCLGDTTNYRYITKSVNDTVMVSRYCPGYDNYFQYTYEGCLKGHSYASCADSVSSSCYIGTDDHENWVITTTIDTVYYEKKISCWKTYISTVITNQWVKIADSLSPFMDKNGSVVERDITNKVGIGTNNPKYQLDIVATKDTIPFHIQMFSDTSAKSALLITNKSRNTLLNILVKGNDMSILAGSDYGLRFKGTNLGVGYNFSSLTTGFGNVGIGIQAGNSISTGNDNTLIGLYCGTTLFNGDENTMVGSDNSANYTGTNGSNNSVFGGGNFQGDGSNNCFFGYHVANGATTGFVTHQKFLGSNNIAIGARAMNYGLTQSDSNVAVGEGSMFWINGGKYNTALGFNALVGSAGSKFTGRLNTSIGFRTMNEITYGQDNTVLGAYAGLELTSGSDNTYLGFMAGGLGFPRVSSHSVGIGNMALLTGNLESYNIAIGDSAGYSWNGNNALFIGKGDSTIAILYADLLKHRLRINGTLLIKTVPTLGSQPTTVLAPSTNGTISQYAWPTATTYSAGYRMGLSGTTFNNTDYHKTIDTVKNNLSVSTTDTLLGKTTTGKIEKVAQSTLTDKYWYWSPGDGLIFNSPYFLRQMMVVGLPDSLMLLRSLINGKQPTGSYELSTNKVNVTSTSTVTYPTSARAKAYADSVAALKQANLVSTTNIKSINGSSILGSGNLTVTASGGVNLADSNKTAAGNYVTRKRLDSLELLNLKKSTIRMLFPPGFVDTTALVKNAGKILIGYTGGSITIDTIIYQLNRQAGTPSVTPTLHYGTDWTAAGTSVVTAPEAVTSYSTVTKISGVTLNNPTITAGNQIWLTWTQTVAPKELYVIILGHYQ
jgi:uncharacterized protein (TIGR02145 family)